MCSVRFNHAIDDRLVELLATHSRSRMAFKDVMNIMDSMYCRRYINELDAERDVRDLMIRIKQELAE